MSLRSGSAFVDILPRLGKGFDQQLTKDLDGSVVGATDSAADKAGSSLTSKLGSSAGKLAATMGAAFAIDKVKDFGQEAVNAASDLNEAVNVTGLVFKDGRAEIEQFVKSSASLGFSERAARELSASVGGLLQNMGLSGSETVEWSKKLLTLGADMGSAFNAEPAEAVEAIGAALRGEAEPIRRFNVVLSDAAVQAEAFRLGLVKADVDATKVEAARVRIAKATQAASAAEKEHGKNSLEAQDARAKLAAAEDAMTKAMEGSNVELTNQQKTQARLSLITQQTAAVQGDFANTSSGAANAARIQAARMENLKASIGSGLLPVQQKLFEVTGSVLGVFEKLSPGQQQAAVGAVALTGALGGSVVALGKVADGAKSVAPAMKAIGGGAVDAVKWIGSVGASAGKMAAQVAASTARIVAAGAQQAAAWAASAARAVASAAVTAASWVASAAAQVASFIASAAAAVASAATTAASWAVSAASAVVSFGITAASAVAAAAAVVAAWLVAAAPFILAGLVIAGLVYIVVRNFDTIKNAIGAAWNFVASATSAAWDFLKSAVSAGLDFVKNLFLNFTGPGLIIKHWDTIKAATSAVIDFIKGAFDSLVAFIVDFPARLARGGSRIFDFLKESFKAAINFVIRGWNGLQFKIPGFDVGPVHFGGFTLGMPDIPVLHSGGIYQAPNGGREGLALLESGERVLSRYDTAALARFEADRTSGLDGGGGRSFRDLVINPARGHSEAEIGRIAARETAWAIKT